MVGPALRPDAPKPDEVIAPALGWALAEPVDVFVFLTGVGARVIMEAAGRAGQEAALRERLAAARVIGRGTKPRRILRQLGVRVDESIDPPVVTGVRDHLLAEAVAGKRIFVQGFGPDPADLTEPLRLAGADVFGMSPYAGSLPDDTAPAADLSRAAVAGDLAAVTFTSAIAAHQFVAIADDAGMNAEDLNTSGALTVAVGPVTRDALEAEGLRVDVEPETPRMGAMYHALAIALRR